MRIQKDGNIKVNTDRLNAAIDKLKVVDGEINIAPEIATPETVSKKIGKIFFGIMDIFKKNRIYQNEIDAFVNYLDCQEKIAIIDRQNASRTRPRPDSLDIINKARQRLELVIKIKDGAAPGNLPM